MMKKFVYLAALALAAAACAENEAVEAVSADGEQSPVYFRTAPITKAHDKFTETNVFESAAWYLESNLTWETDWTSGVSYIPASEISYSNGIWRSVKPYYWPKNGATLSFYSWSLNKADLAFNQGSTASVTIDREKGVVLTGFDITVDNDIDFLVADPALNQSRNLHLYYTDGVPTLFRHKLSSLRVTAVTDEDYSDSKEITITEIKVTDVAKKADYQEGEKDGQTGEWSQIDRWTVDDTAGTYDADFYDGSDGGTSVTDSKVEIGGQQTIYLPQNFTGNEMLEITYTVKDKFSGVEETITVKIPLKDALKTASQQEGSFEGGKAYTLNLKFTLSLVYWDPAVEQWDDVQNGVTVGE